MEKTLAVLITVYNRRIKTIECLTNLYAQKLQRYIGFDVFLVDDGCTDGTVQAVREQFPQVHVISADGSLYWNRGMHRAWDVAAKHKSYDYFLWLNDDTMLLPNSLDVMITLSTNYCDNAIVVGATKSSKEEKLTYGGRVGGRIPMCDGMPHEVEYFNGNIVLVPQTVFSSLGNLDYYYAHSKGDYDYGIRARKKGIKMYQCGDVLGICDEHEHIDQWCDPDVPFSKRWKFMHMPNGMPPHEIFHLEKQNSVLKAVFHFVTVYIRCFFPQLWRKRNL